VDDVSTVEKRYASMPLEKLRSLAMDTGLPVSGKSSKKLARMLAEHEVTSQSSR
jgi:hypothetical protein